MLLCGLLTLIRRRRGMFFGEMVILMAIEVAGGSGKKLLDLMDVTGEYKQDIHRQLAL